VKLKLDENLPATLAAPLAALGHEVDTVPGEGLTGRPDPTVWAAAQAAQRFLVTQDLDFSDIRRYAPGTHCGLLLIRLRYPSGAALRRRIEMIFEFEDVETWRRCFVVVTERKVRVRRPPDEPLKAP